MSGFDDFLHVARSWETEESEIFRILCVQLDQGKLSLEIELQGGDGTLQRWSLSIPEPLDWSFTPDNSTPVFFWDDHPLLWTHHRSHFELYFSSRPEDPAAVVGQLYNEHEHAVRDWIRFGCFTNHDLLRHLTGGHGLLAKGPEPLVRVYEDVLRKLGVRCNLLSVSAGARQPDARALVFGSTFIVATEFAAERIDVG